MAEYRKPKRIRSKRKRKTFTVGPPREEDREPFTHDSDLEVDIDQFPEVPIDPFYKDRYR